MSDRVEMTIASADLPPHIQFVAVRQEAMRELLRIDVNGVMTVGAGLSADEATQAAAKMLVDEFAKAHNTEIASLRAELSRLSALVAEWQKAAEPLICAIERLDYYIAPHDASRAYVMPPDGPLYELLDGVCPVTLADFRRLTQLKDTTNADK